MQYLTDGTLPTDPLEAKRFRRTVSQYILMNGQLYKRSFSLLLLKCLRLADADYVLREVHEEIYENHLGANLRLIKSYDEDIIGPS